jgi:predicted amidohydrolase
MPGRKLKIALVQLEIVPGDPPLNLHQAQNLMIAARAQGARLAILPELWTCGGNVDDFRRLAEKIQGPTVGVLRETAAELEMGIIAGSIPEQHGELVYNTSLLISPDGNLVGRYRKTHLAPFFGEDQYFIAGKDLAVFRLCGCNVGLMLSFELSFPEMARGLALAGAELIAVPALWPRAQAEQWKILLRARGMENQCFVAGVNGIHGGRVRGLSRLVGPTGKTLAFADESQQVIVREINLSQISRVRARINALDLRRPELYGEMGRN